MKERDIQNTVLAGFQDELKSRTPTYLYEMFMMTLRSIYPDVESDSNEVNYERFSEEIKLWRYYRRGGNEALNELVLRGKKTDLFEESSFARVIPIFLANQELDKAIKVAFKNIFYTTENIDCIFSAISFGVLLSNKLNGLSMTESFDVLKESVISFRTVEFLKDTNKANDNIYLIKIESKKIEIIQTIDRFVSKYLELVSLKDEQIEQIQEIQESEGSGQPEKPEQSRSFAEESVEDSEVIADSKESATENTDFSNYESIVVEFISSISKSETQSIGRIIKPFLNESIEIENNYLRNIGSYVYRIRKGRVSAESLKFKKSEDVSVFTLKEGDKFVNSVLGESVLEKITVENGFELRYVRSKSGKYRFFRKAG